MAEDEKTISCQYTLDEEDRIVHFDEFFAEFAIRNGATALLSDLQGESIYRFISGKTTQRFYQRLFSSIRNLQRPGMFDFRCDAPNARRFMRFRLDPKPNDHLLITTYLVNIDAREEFIHLRADLMSKQMLSVCSICLRGKMAGDFVEIEEILSHQSLNRPAIATLFCVCGDCQTSVLKIGGSSGAACP